MDGTGDGAIGSGMAVFSSATGAGGANTGGKSRLGSSVCTSGAETSGDDLGLAGLGAVDSTPNLWS